MCKTAVVWGFASQIGKPEDQGDKSDGQGPFKTKWKGFWSASILYYHVLFVFHWAATSGRRFGMFFVQ